MRSCNLLPAHEIPELDSSTLPIVIVGNGPVGIKAAKLVLERDPDANIVIFGEERNKPYNRVQLSLFLAGKVSKAQLDNPVTLSPDPRLTEYIGRRIIAIVRQKNSVIDDSGNVYPYSKLILALGSSPNIPPIENLNVSGVHQFRTIEDTNRLLQSKTHAKAIHIVGSGALGLETAFAMKQPNNRVTLHVREQLLSNHFNMDAQQVLADYIEASGIRISTNGSICRAIGNDTIDSIELENGERLDCDCLIFCSGIKPNKSLAEKVGLLTHRGIVVDRNGQTSDIHIYAIGECCEYANKTFGLVSPGFKQAKSCIEHIYGGLVELKEDTPHIQVKFGDYTTAYYGDLEQEGCSYYTHSNRLKGIYRKIVVHENRIVGAVLVGNWEEENDVKVAIMERHKVREKALRAFEDTGLLLNKPTEQSIKNLPEDYLVCLCESVSRGELSHAVKNGCRTIDTLGAKTRAGTVCGSCKPLLANLLDTPAPNLVMRHQKTILVTSVVSILLIVLTIFFQPLAITDTVQFDWHIEKLWFDPFWKQVSGYSLLGMCVLASALGLRKRWKRFNFGHLDSWRYAHSLVGVIALLVLMIHTGVRLGSNLNFILMSVFLAATVTGSLVGIFMSKNHHWSDFKLRTHRLWWSRVHHTLLWMLPPLIIFHIISVYYF